MEQALLRIKQKDYLDIIRAKTRRCHVCKEDIPFLNEVKRAVEVLHPKAHHIATVLKEFVDISPVEPMVTELRECLDIPFFDLIVDKELKFEEILQAFHDIDFYKFLVTANLSRRMEILFKETPGQVKLRIYYAILNYNEYKKGEWKTATAI